MRSSSKPEPQTRVLDAWVLLGWLKDQDPAATFMEQLWHKAQARQADLILHSMNLGEVYYLAARAKGIHTAEFVLEDLRTRPLQIWPVSDEMVLDAARLKARFRVSYADAFAVLTARTLQAPLVTGDPELRPLEKAGEVELEWVESSWSR